MKWTVQELIKRINTDNTFEATLDFSTYLDNTDIIRISPVEVRGEFEIYDNSEFVFFYDVNCTITMLGAITLEEIDVELDFEVEETFTTDKNDEFNLIEGITIDLLPIIWSNIILEKPMRVVSENATTDFEENNVEFETENTNTAFAELKTYKN